MVVINHSMQYRGATIYGGMERNFIKCTCGVEIFYKFGEEDPFKKLEKHTREMQVLAKTNAKVEHKYAGRITLHGIDYVKCTCGWNKRLKSYKDPLNVWEGHRGYESHNDVKASRGSTKVTTTSKIKEKAKNYWNGDYYYYGKKNWAAIEPISQEIFGGTFFVLPNKSK